MKLYRQSRVGVRGIGIISVGFESSKSLGVSFSAMGIACSDIANIGVWNEVRINSVWSSRVGMSRVSEFWVNIFNFG